MALIGANNFAPSAFALEGGRTPKPGLRDSVRELGKDTPAVPILYLNKNDGRYELVQIYRGNLLVRTLDDRYGTYEAELPPVLSDSGNIALLHQVDSGIAESPDNGAIKHERYYCAFVDIRNGCVLERRTGEFCSGNWAEADQWNKLDGTLIDIGVQKITAESILHMENSPADGPVWNFDNLLHCDSITDRNRDAYSRILEHNHFSLSDDQLHSARIKLATDGG